MLDPTAFVIACVATLAAWYGLLGLCAYLVTVTRDPRVLHYLAEVIAAARRSRSMPWGGRTAGGRSRRKR